MNYSIKEFNEKLNKSDINRFEKWAEYRNELTRNIVKNINVSEYKSLLILGAGNMDDLDLNIFDKNFNEITLADIDVYALKSAINKYRPDNSRIETKFSEFTGLEQNPIWRNFSSEIYNIHNVEEIDVIFKKLKNTVKNHKLNFDRKYDVVIICPIYTQFILQQAFQELDILQEKGYPEGNVGYIKEKILDLLTVIIDTFNQNVIELLNYKGILIVNSDIFEAELGSDFHKEIQNTFNEIEKMENLYQLYIRKYGIGVGDFGILNMEEFISPIAFKWFEWPFDEKRLIYVKQELFKNNV